MNFSVTILGSNSAIPTTSRNPSSQLINHNENYFLVDCAEGTQLQLRKHRIRMQKIKNVFISHLHGDHYFGLIGLISTFHLLGRKDKLTIYAPSKLKDIVDLQLSASDTILNYELSFVDTHTDTIRLLYENPKLQVFSFPLEHSLPTTGFLFKEKKGERKIRKERIKTIDIPSHFFRQILDGDDFVDADGKLYSNAYLSSPPPPPRTYAYCSDTRFSKKISGFVKNVDLLYHEATFMEELKDVASERGHSTAREAALIAQTAKVKRLLIGHFSSRYQNVKDIENEAREVFVNTIAVDDGDVYSI
jgi:ribonuclease Z